MTLSEEERLYAEQLRLVLEGVAQSVAVGFFVSTLMLAVLWRSVSHAIIVGWYAAFLVERISAAAFARRAGHAARDPRRNRGIERALFATKVVEGSIYGSLPWIALPLQMPAVSILTMSLMGALCSNGVSLLAPRPHLYLALVVPIASMAAISLWALGGAPYHALAIYSVLFIVGQYGQVILASRRIRESIALRFENAGLIEQLRAETAVADLARQDAERANATKSQLLAAASHDLRQPVHALRLSLQALSQEDLVDGQRLILRTAQRANEASADMLDKLLDYSRLEAGAVVPRLAGFTLQPLLDRIENDLAHFADAKRLIHRSRPTSLAVVSDRALLDIILRNFVLNAIRYADRGGILIGCRRRGAGVSIEVYDTGIGIPEDELEEVFRAFYQVDDSPRDGSKGVGLGLAIVRGLAATLEHPVSLSSVRGRGSVFRILVPGAPEAMAGIDRPSAARAAADAEGATARHDQSVPK